jgi:hypothetical protein
MGLPRVQLTQLTVQQTPSSKVSRVYRYMRCGVPSAHSEAVSVLLFHRLRLRPVLLARP